MKVQSGVAVLAAIAASVAGCATLTHGTRQQVRFESTPSEATVEVGALTVTTPGELTLSRGSTYDVEFVKRGYIPAHGHIGQSSSDAVWGNLLLGGLVGLIVDYSDGA